MPHTSSAKKRLRQTEKRNARNRATKRAVKTHIKRFMDAITPEQLKGEEGEKKANDAYRLAVKRLDQAAAKKVIHKNTASRKKSQLSRYLHTATSKQS